MKLFKMATLLLVSMMFVGCNSANMGEVKPEIIVGAVTVDNKLESSEVNIAKTDVVALVKKDKLLNAKLHFINTGQSDCILIESNTEFMLIDGGDKDDDTTVKTYLQKVGVKNLKYVVATHFHADHLGGLDTIVKDFGAESVFVPNDDANTAVYKEFIQSCIDRNLKPSVPLPDVTFTLGNSTFRFLNVKGGYSNTNDNSLIVEVTSGNTKSLFMGDAEAEVEKAILNELRDVNILKVGHHGSSSSTTQAFLDKVKPEVAIIQTGIGNKYGHPNVETMQKLQDKHIVVHRNDECGDIVYTITNKGYTTDCQIVGSYNNGNKDDNTPQINNSTEAVGPKPISVPKQNTSKPNSKIVYITKTGSKYHLGSCKTLKSKIESTVEDVKAQGLEPCSVCKP